MNPDLKVEKEDVTHTLRLTEVLTGCSRLALILKVCTGQECKEGRWQRRFVSRLLEFQNSKWKNVFVYSKDIGENWSTSLMAGILSISFRCSHCGSFHSLAVGSAWEALPKISTGQIPHPMRPSQQAPPPTHTHSFNRSFHLSMTCPIPITMLRHWCISYTYHLVLCKADI